MAQVPGQQLYPFVRQLSQRRCRCFDIPPEAQALAYRAGNFIRYPKFVGDRDYYWAYGVRGTALDVSGGLLDYYGAVGLHDPLNRLGSVVNQLRSLRQASMFSQRDLAVRSGSTQATISALESGRRTAQPRTVRRLAEALEVEPKDLLGEG